MTKSIQTRQMKGSPIPASDDKPGAETVSPTPPATAEPKSTLPSKPLSKLMNMVSDSRSFQFTHPLTHTPPPPPLQKSTSSTQTTSQPTAIKKTPSKTSPNIIPFPSSDSKPPAQQKSLLEMQKSTAPHAVTVKDTEVSRAATVLEDPAWKQKLDLTKDRDANASLQAISIPAGDNGKAKVRERI